MLVRILLFTLFSCIVAAASLLSTSDEATAVTAIVQAINKFPLFVDGHQFDRLTEVFTPNATANLHPPNNQVYYGVQEIIAGVDSLQDVSSQHGFTSHYVNVTSASAANATVYLFANFYGKGQQTGQIFTLYGTYEILMEKTQDDWLVNYIELFTHMVIGNSSIAFPTKTSSQV